MSELSPNARAQLAAAGISTEQWIANGGWYDVELDENGVRRVTRDGKWRGDRCGCTDDRCIGHHHDAREDCGCLPVLIETFGKNREAHAIWAEYRAAVEANDGRGDQDAYEAAWSRAEAWVRRYHPRALTFSLDAFVKGERGISATFPPFEDGTIPQWVSTVPEGEGYRMQLWDGRADEYGHIDTLPTGAVIGA